MICLLQMRDAKSEDSLKRGEAGLDALGLQNCNVGKVHFVKDLSVYFIKL